jgi:hypothetical protein
VGPGHRRLPAARNRRRPAKSGVLEGKRSRPGVHNGRDRLSRHVQVFENLTPTTTI